MKILILRRLRRNGTRANNYSYKFTWRGRQVFKATKFSAELSGTHEQARADARAVARAHARALELGCVAQVDGLRTRGARACPTLADLQPVFENGALGRLSEGSARAAWLQLLNILRRSCSGARESAGLLDTPLSTLNSALIQRYAQSVLDSAVAEQAGDRRLNQLKRSANSTWSTARMLFGKSMRAYYASVGLTLPPSIDTFCKTSPFPGKIGKKTQYDTPPDHIIAATFRDLEEVQRAANPNLYAAVHLALAFGLRKGEIIGARVRDIMWKTSPGHVAPSPPLASAKPFGVAGSGERAGVRGSAPSPPSGERAGVRGFEVCENWVARRPRDVPKNGAEQPFIHPKNQSLARLEPLLAGRPPEDYILTGRHKSARVEYPFRDISRWMRGLGWGTQKTIHEFRAYAIAQVAAAEGIFEASKWARHSSVVITQANYGHHCRRTHLDLPIQLPEIPATFTPAIVPKIATA